MELHFDRDHLLQKLLTASRFVSDKLASANTLKGIFLSSRDDTLHIYATNLSMYYHTSFSFVGIPSFQCIIDPRKIIEFLNLLQPGKIQVEVGEKQIQIAQLKNKGNFPLIMNDEFPLPPLITDEERDMEEKFFTEKLPFILFTASSDDSRPTLTGINFVVKEDELLIVSTDGFRLSLYKEKSKGKFEAMIVPAAFLQEVIRVLSGKGTLKFAYSQKEQTVLIRTNEDSFYSRLIDGEFPPFERVVPTEKETTIICNREELLRGTKLISIFARDFSNVVLYDFVDKTLIIRPKKEANAQNTAVVDAEIQGQPQQVAFNFKYLLDYLNHTKAEEICIEILRSDAPVVFYEKGSSDFRHIIMPVRIQE